jgi:hypothetical protein
MVVVLLLQMLLTQACELQLIDFDCVSLLMAFVRFVKILVIEIFSSVLGLFGLIIGLLVSSKAAEFE